MKRGMFLLGALIVTCAVALVSGREPNPVPAKWSPRLRMCGNCRKHAYASATGGHGTDFQPGCNLLRDWSLGSPSLAPFLGGASGPARLRFVSRHARPMTRPAFVGTFQVGNWAVIRLLRPASVALISRVTSGASSLGLLLGTKSVCVNRTAGAGEWIRDGTDERYQRLNVRLRERIAPCRHEC